MPVEVAVAGRLQAWLANWVAIGTSNQVLAWIQHSVPVALWGDLPSIGIQCDFSGDQLEWLLVELPWLVSVGSVVDLGNSILQPIGIDVVSPVNLAPKKGPKQWQLVHDLHRLNMVMPPCPCKFKTLKTLAQLVG
jgi:hypothetical protein